LRKERIYLDTSVISYLDQQDSPEKMLETQQFWDLLKLDCYEIILSNITQEELGECQMDKQIIFAKFLNELNYINANETLESISLAREYLRQTVLTEKSLDDCRHIALASIYECDYIVSWNFRHMANIKVVNKVQGVNRLLGYKLLIIYPPTEFLYEE